MKKITFKHFLFLLPIGLLLCGATVQWRALNGAVEAAPDAKLSSRAWFDGSYQKAKEAYLNDNFRGRRAAIRLHNQYEYSFFGNIYARDVVEGKNGFLFEKSYITSYCGRDVEKEKPIADAMIVRTLKLNEWLHAQGKELFIVVAPSKASFAPENIPAALGCIATKNNPYQYTIDNLNKTNINVIDFSAYFKTQKNKSPYSLFTAYGVHWSIYGAALAFDSTTNYIAKKLNTKLPDLKINSVTTTYDCGKDADCDLLDGMNLMQQKKLPERRAVPTISWDDTPKSKLNVLFIADSFMWSWVKLYLPHNVFNDYDFWFYNNESWGKAGEYHKKEELNPLNADRKSVV